MSSIIYHSLELNLLNSRGNNLALLLGWLATARASESQLATVIHENLRERLHLRNRLVTFTIFNFSGGIGLAIMPGGQPRSSKDHVHFFDGKASNFGYDEVDVE